MRLSWMLEFSTVEISAFRFIDTSTYQIKIKTSFQ
jgi:hypothetical protein